MAKVSSRVWVYSALTLTGFVAIVYLFRRFLQKENKENERVEDVPTTSTTVENTRNSNDNEVVTNQEIGQGDHVANTQTCVETVPSVKPIDMKSVLLSQLRDTTYNSDCSVDESLIVEIDSDEELTSTIEVIELDSDSFQYRSMMGNIDEGNLMRGDNDDEDSILSSTSSSEGLGESTLKSSVWDESALSAFKSSILDDSNMITANSSFMNSSEYTTAIVDEMDGPELERISPLPDNMINSINSTDEDSVPLIGEKNMDDEITGLKSDKPQKLGKKSPIKNRSYNAHGCMKMKGESDESFIRRSKAVGNFNKNYSVDDDNVASETESVDSNGDLSDDSLNITETIDEIASNVSSKCKEEESCNDVIVLDDSRDEQSVIEISSCDEVDDLTPVTLDDSDCIITETKSKESITSKGSDSSVQRDNKIRSNNSANQKSKPMDTVRNNNIIKTASNTDNNEKQRSAIQIDKINNKMLSSPNTSNGDVNSIIRETVENFVTVNTSLKSPNVKGNNYKSSDIQKALETASKSPSLVDQKSCDILISLLQHDDVTMRVRVLNLLANCAAFSSNHTKLRKAGTFQALLTLLDTQSELTTDDQSLASNCTVTDTDILPSLCKAVNNLAMNETYSIQMAEFIQPLVNITVSPAISNTLKLSPLQCLTNLSVLDTHHNLYIPLIPQLFRLVDSAVEATQLQSIRILVNLSCNEVMVPHLLAAKTPDRSLELLASGTDEAPLVRWTTLLANLITVTVDNNIVATSLPYTDKAASPETVFTFLYGVNSIGSVKTRAFILSSHRNEDIRRQATKIYSGLSRTTVL